MKINYILIIAFAFFTQRIAAQGCSDAGVCSIDKHEESSSSQKLNVSLGQTAELGENIIVYFHSVFGVRLNINDASVLSLSVPYRNALYKGDLYSGIGDVTLSYSTKLFNDISVSTAIKIPTSDANNKDANNMPLPMALQSGLGTYDGIISLSYMWNVHRITLGYQHAFSDNNNQFVSSGRFAEFGTSAFLNRGDDLMLRYDRSFGTENKRWRTSLVGVYRLGGDRVNDGELVSESEGISLNLAITRDVTIGNRNLELMLAGPLYARKARVDGLTRNIILSVKMNGLFQ